MSNNETVLAVYDNFQTANAVISDLETAGFSRSDISLAANNVTGEYAHEDIVDDVSGSEGAGFGAAVGTITGAVAGLAAIVIPGIGPIIAAGPIAALIGGATGAVVGATAGAVTGGLTASLVHIGIPDEDATYYTESVRRGSALVTVSAIDDTDVNKAMKIMRQHQPVNVEHRVNNWRNKGWVGFDPEASPYTEEELKMEREAYLHNAGETLNDNTVRRYPPVPPVR